MNGQDDRDQDALVEILGIFANMTTADCDIENLALKYDLVNWLNKFLIPGFAQDDIVLEVRKTPSWPRSWANFSLL